MTTKNFLHDNYLETARSKLAFLKLLMGNEDYEILVKIVAEEISDDLKPSGSSGTRVTIQGKAIGTDSTDNSVV